MFCPTCGAEQLQGTSFCNVCGSELPKNQKDLNNDSQMMNSDIGTHQMQPHNQMMNSDMGMHQMQYPNQMMNPNMGMQQYPHQMPNQQININITHDQPKKSSRNKFIAALLAFLFGGFGIHKFYLGKPFWGILYLLFFWTFIPELVSYIEGICYICTPDDTWDQKY